MEDAKIVELFLNRSEMAIQETKSKYHGYLHHLVYNILYDSCDTEEIVDDTYMGAWNSIPPTIPENLKYFLSRIARNLSLNRLEYQRAGKRHAQLVELDECIPDTRQSVERIWEAKELGELLNRFLGTLDRKTCAVFLGRYYYFYSTEELAGQYGLTKRQVKYILAKTRSRLSDHLRKEEVEL